MQKNLNDLSRVSRQNSLSGVIRNERNIVARRTKTAQVAVKRAWHEAEHANVHQRDDPTWISSFPRVAKLIPESSKQSKNIFDPYPRNVAYVA